jgi:colanic acid biosynthesis glycosyl transferase WcaI
LRILVLNQYFHPDRSATSQLLTELCEDLATYHEVLVVAGRPSYNPGERPSSRGIVSCEHHGDVSVRRVWSTSFDRESMPRRLMNYASYLCTSLVGGLSVRRPDVVVALTDPPPIGLIAAGVAALKRVPFVLVTKDVFPDVAVALGKLKQPSVIWALRRMAALLFRRAERVVSIGHDMSARLHDLDVPFEKIQVIHDWADGRLLKPLKGPSARVRELGWDDRFVVMHSGNVGLSQGLETVLDAAELLRDDAEILFAIVGDGASKRQLMTAAESRRLTNVVFLPFQPKEELAESLGAGDCHLVTLKRGLAGFIVPSKVYGIMAAARPFIAAVEAGSEPARIIADHRCGLRVDPEDPLRLAEAVRQMRELPFEEMGARGRAAFERLYDRPIATNAYRQLLESYNRRG